MRAAQLIPKVMEALSWVRQFPRQIASDLSRFHHRRIADWYSGEMLSYELLELLEFMPEHGAFKTAMRGGEYTEEQLTIRHGVNEIARLRATMHAVHGGQRYEPPTLPSKAELIAEMEDAQAAEERREEIYSAFDRDSKMIEA